LNGFDLLGGIRAESGGVVTLNGNVSGGVAAYGEGTSVNIEGDVYNGVSAYDRGTVNIEGDVYGEGLGNVEAENYGDVIIGGSVYDGGVIAWDYGTVIIDGGVYGEYYGYVEAGNYAAVIISGDVFGNIMVYTGGTVTINGALIVDDDNMLVMIDGIWLGKQDGIYSINKPGYLEYTTDMSTSAVLVKVPEPGDDPDLQITGYTLVGSTRFGLAAYDYELTAHVVNLGGAAENVIAFLTGYQADVVTVIKGVIELGDIPANGTSQGNFIIRIPINRNAAYDESHLKFTFSYTE